MPEVTVGEFNMEDRLVRVRRFATHQTAWEYYYGRAQSGDRINGCWKILEKGV